MRIRVKGGSNGLTENRVDGQAPARHGRLGFRDVAATVDGRVVRVGRPVNSHRLGVGVYVPDDLTAGEKVIVSLLGDVDLGGRTVIVRTADLNGEGRATFEEPPLVGGKRTGVVGGVRRKRPAPVRQWRLDRAAE